MKKQYIFLGLAMLLTFGGCKKEKEGVPVTFSATIERSMAKVHLDADIKPLWDANDVIHVNDGTGSVTPLTNEHRGSFTATINSNTDGPYYAVYPASMVADDADLTVPSDQVVTLPRVQLYRTTSPSSGVQLIDAPMAAYNNGATRNLEFKNLCGLMQIVVTNDKAWDMILDSIQVEASDKAIRSGLSINAFKTAEPYIQAGDRGTYSLENENYNKNVVSLAKANDQSIGTFVKSSMWGSGSTTCTVYVYIPKIPQNASNKFTIRVFSHPVWDKADNANTFGDAEVHIVYTKTQSATTMGYIGRSELVKVPVSLASCGLDGTTFTSMKAFSADKNNPNHKICFSRGHIQYDCATERKRFAPRQWSFLHKATMDDAQYSGWIEHFCWATGGDFDDHRNGTAIHDNGDNHLYDGNGNPTSADWGYHFTNYGSRIWRTPKRTECKNIFFPDYSGIAMTTAPQDTCKRFIWVELSGVPEIGTDKLYAIIVFPDAIMAAYRNTTPESQDNIKNEPGAVQLSLPAMRFTVGGNKKYDDNKLNVQQLEYYEAKGCILLPCFGSYDDYGRGNDLWNKSIREGVPTDGPEGSYWTSTYHLGNQIYNLKVKTGYGHTNCYVYPESDAYGDRRFLVRLVCDYGTAYIWDPDQM